MIFYQQTANSGYFNCLNIWSEFLDYVINNLESKSVTGRDEQLTK